MNVVVSLFGWGDAAHSAGTRCSNCCRIDVIRCCCCCRWHCRSRSHRVGDRQRWARVVMKAATACTTSNDLSSVDVAHCPWASNGVAASWLVALLLSFVEVAACARLLVIRLRQVWRLAYEPTSRREHGTKSLWVHRTCWLGYWEVSWLTDENGRAD